MPNNLSRYNRFTHKYLNVNKIKQKRKNQGEIQNKIKEYIKQKNEILANKKNMINLNNNLNAMREKNIIVVNHVYQFKYKFDKNGTGLGDFIRGSYFILEFCNKHNFQPNIIFNNYISNFLSNKTENLDQIQNELANTSYFEPDNWVNLNVNQNNSISLPTLGNRVKFMNEFITYINECEVYNHNIYTYCKTFPFEPETIANSKAYMQNILKPNNEMSLYIDTVLNNLSLVKKKYTVIHIRSGDDYLNQIKNKFTVRYVHTLFKHINLSSNFKYLLISDNNEIKKIILQLYPQICAFFKEITHMGEGVVLEEDKVKNTMLDFYLLSFSKQIYSFSVYEHGTGFSYWCAKTYDIPHSCKYIGL